MYYCANCSVHACSKAKPETLPKNCPMRYPELLNQTVEAYGDNRDFYIASSEIEAQGYGEWVRVREVIEFSKKMNYRKLGLAFCRGLRTEARILAGILKAHDFEVVSVICKAGGVDKTEVGIDEENKVRPGTFEPMCNPIFQAELLNQEKTQFNIALGLCVGHDSLFYKYSEAMVTMLVAKDRVLGHNPVAALYQADGYCKSRLLPEK